MPRLVGALVFVALLALSCGGAEDNGGDAAPDEAAEQPEETENTVDIDMTEYIFDVSGSPEAGALTLNFENIGGSIHHAIVGRLDEGRTLEDVEREILRGEQGPPPPWFHDDPADMSVLSPGQSASVTIEAQEGTYVLLCFIPTPEGEPHAAQGMIQTFEVDGEAGAEPPETEGEFVMSQDELSTPELEEGTVDVEVRNDGNAPADFHVIRLEGDSSLEDIDPWFNRGMRGDPPATFFGGTHAVEPGGSVVMSLFLEPGTYTAVATYQRRGRPQDVAAEFTVP